MEDLRLRLDELRKWQQELEDEVVANRNRVRRAEENVKRLEVRLEVYKLGKDLSEASGLVALKEQVDAAKEELARLQADPRLKDVEQLIAGIREHEQVIQSRYQVELLQHTE